MKLYNKIRKIFAYLATIVVFALATLFMALFIHDLNDEAYINAEATIIEIINNDDEAYSIIEFIDQDGTHRTSNFDYSIRFHVGDTLPISYKIVDGTLFCKRQGPQYFILIISGFLYFLGTLVIVFTRRSVKKTEEIIGVAEDIKEKTDLEFEINEDMYNSYVFQPNGRAGFVLTSLENEVLYEARKEKDHFLKPSDFTFIDYDTGFKQSHKISILVSKDHYYQSFDTPSSFKIDGVNCFEYLKSKGLKVDYYDTKLNIRKYTVRYQGEIIGLIQMSSRQDVYGPIDDKARLFNSFYFKVKTSSEHISHMFLATFVVCRCEGYVKTI